MANLTSRIIDPFFDEFFQNESNSKYNQVMKTDIRDLEDHYEFKVEMPDIKKEDIKISLSDGYLTVEASRKQDEEASSKYIRQERYFGSYKRSFYVGDEFRSEDVKAKLENGILTLNCYKKPEVSPEEQLISIE